MTGALLVVAIVIAAAACPAMMWLQARRGRRASCVAPGNPVVLDELRRRRADLDAAIGQREDAHGAQHEQSERLAR